MYTKLTVRQMIYNLQQIPEEQQDSPLAVGKVDGTGWTIEESGVEGVEQHPCGESPTGSIWVVIPMQDDSANGGG